MLHHIYYFSSVIGALIGKQEGRNIEVMNSFELLSHTIDERVHIDKEYYYTKEEQCKSFLCGKILILQINLTLLMSKIVCHGKVVNVILTINKYFISSSGCI